MSSGPTNPNAAEPRRARPARLLGGLTVALVFVLATSKVTSYDTWVHLSLGRWMAETGRVPRTNLLSHTMPERPTLDHQWLFQAGLYRLWRLVGAPGAILAKAALAAAAFGLVLAAARRKRAHLLVGAAVALVAALAARFRFTLRPQVVAFLLFSAYLYLIERWRNGQWRGLLALLPLQVLWANVHGSAILGIALGVAVAASESLRALLARGARPPTPAPRGPRDLKILWAVALALLPLSLLNPNGSRLLALPFAHDVAQATSGLKSMLLDRASVRWAELGSRHLFFTVLAAAGLASLVVSAARKDTTEVGLFLGLLVVALRSERFVGIFAIAAAPIVARNLSVLLRPRLHLGPLPWRRAVPVAVALVALAAVDVYRRRGDLPLGLGPHERILPARALDHIQTHYPTGNLLNEFEHGGYIHWRTRRPVFLDSRGLLAYDPAFVRAYVATWDPAVAPRVARRHWAALVEERAITVALVTRPGLRRHFAGDLRWTRVFESQSHAVFVRRARP